MTITKSKAMAIVSTAIDTGTPITQKNLASILMLLLRGEDRQEQPPSESKPKYVALPYDKVEGEIRYYIKPVPSFLPPGSKLYYIYDEGRRRYKLKLTEMLDKPDYFALLDRARQEVADAKEVSK